MARKQKDLEALKVELQLIRSKDASLELQQRNLQLKIQRIKKQSDDIQKKRTKLQARGRHLQSYLE